MAVRSREGRVRYVAFRVEGGPLARADLAGLLPPPARLTRFDGTHGIVRTTHLARDATVAFLRGLASVRGRSVRVETLTTSGTIRKAATALPPGSPAAKRGRKAPDAQAGRDR